MQGRHLFLPCQSCNNPALLPGKRVRGRREQSISITKPLSYTALFWRESSSVSVWCLLYLHILFQLLKFCRALNRLAAYSWTSICYRHNVKIRNRDSCIKPQDQQLPSPFYRTAMAAHKAYYETTHKFNMDKL